MASTSATPLSITIEFGGGTEFLTSTKKVKKHVLQVPRTINDNDNSTAATAAGTVVAPKVSLEATDDGADAKTHAATMRDLVQVVLKELITERHSMLVEPDGSIRPGILILINEADWELEGEMEYELQDRDHICFISTLHGG
ncbi:hypothetical protein CBS101457_003235 [Exobasidium rhododendri]|nr:hypothetical protein CBS101457_003235 [Exobasidium rhododendri]